MNLYFAPLEGLGSYVYRNAQSDLFARADKYFAPFLSPGSKKRLTPKALRDIAPEHNRNVNLVPQVLTNDAQAFVETVRELADLGYREVNLNLGCPSKTVVNKGRGAGFLADPDALDRFLDTVFCAVDASYGSTADAAGAETAGSRTDGGGMRISLKTRIGMRDPQEFARLLDIYNQYPVSELTVHPRVQADYYRNRPNPEAFSRALEQAKMPVVYNGDLFNLTAFVQFHASFPTVRAVMLGRGVLCDPALFGEIRAALTEPSRDGENRCGEERLTKEQLWIFHERLLKDYTQILSGESHVLFKMKELWFYMGHVFSDSAKYGKEIQKAQKMRDYRETVRKLFEECALRESDFPGRSRPV